VELIELRFIFFAIIGLALIFFALSGIHLYWAMGGKWGISASVPTKVTGEAVFSPSVLATLIVAFGLFAMGVIQLIGTFASIDVRSSPTFKFAELAIALIFLVRAIGDFKYVGFFKKIKGTTFAQNDTKFYSPLCLVISMAAGWIAFHI
jgi:Protein of unknown function (DUF3995)